LLANISQRHVKRVARMRSITRRRSHSCSRPLATARWKRHRSTRAPAGGIPRRSIWRRWGEAGDPEACLPMEIW